VLQEGWLPATLGGWKPPFLGKIGAARVWFSVGGSETAARWAQLPVPVLVSEKARDSLTWYQTCIAGAIDLAAGIDYIVKIGRAAIVAHDQARFQRGLKGWRGDSTADGTAQHTAAAVGTNVTRIQYGNQT
jgi:hypothetical protein